MIRRETNPQKRREARGSVREGRWLIRHQEITLSWSEITKFLIEMPSPYAYEARKAFTTLEGYDFSEKATFKTASITMSMHQNHSVLSN